MNWLLFFALLVDPILVELGRTYSPDTFIINNSTHLSQEVFNATYPLQVNKLNDESLSLDAGCVAVVSCPRCTQYAFEFTPLLHGTQQVSVRFRTTRSDYRSNPDYGLRVDFADTRMVVWENARVIATVDSVTFASDNVERIVIENYAGTYTVIKGCRVLYRGSTTLPATDGIVFETSPSTSAELRAIIRNDIHSLH